MNSMILILGLVALATIGAKRQEDKPPVSGDDIPDEVVSDPVLGWGQILYKGVRTPQQIFGETYAVDYDFKVQINGYKTDGSPLMVATGNWDYRNSPSKIFNMAWQDYLAQGGDPKYNWKVNFDDNYYKYAEKDKKLDEVLAWVEFLWPDLRLDIEKRIPENVKDNIQIIIDSPLNR